MPDEGVQDDSRPPFCTDRAIEKGKAVRIVILGPPGSGKSVQAARIATRYNIPAISTGDIFRASQTATTPWAAEIRAAMASGSYVPDEIADTVITERLNRPDCQTGFVLAGYPRTLPQAGTLDAHLSRDHTLPTFVVTLTISPAEVIRRLVVRSWLHADTDGDSDTVATKLRLYQNRTTPVLHQYGLRSQLVDIDAEGHATEVTDRINHALATR